MFETFRLKSWSTIFSCQTIARHASIEPLIEGCNCSGFVVQLHEFEFEKYQRVCRGISAFVTVIEERIAARDFENLFIHPASSELDWTNAPRVVFNPGGRVLLVWDNAKEQTQEGWKIVH